MESVTQLQSLQRHAEAKSSSVLHLYCASPKKCNNAEGVSHMSQWSKVLHLSAKGITTDTLFKSRLYHNWL